MSMPRGPMTDVVVDRRAVLRFRFRRQQLDAEDGSFPDGTAITVLDFGVQDTGRDGAAWALVLRGARTSVLDDLVFAWTLRGAPHAYRRPQVSAVAVATAPFSESDAAKRIFDAAKSLKAAGIPALEALRTVAGHLRDIVDQPTAKGDASTRLSGLVDAPYLRFCRACNATHVYENTFRLAALQAGLELEPGSSPPVLRRIPGVSPAMYRHLGGEADARFHVIRNYLRFYGPARMRDAAEFLDAPAKTIQEHWPHDVAVVRLADEPSSPRSEPRFVLAEDLAQLTATSGGPDPQLRLLGPYDPCLQLRDRDVLVPDATQRKALWPVLGRPGAIVADGEVIGLWRPRASGSRLRVAIEPWQKMPARQLRRVEEQAERLAHHRGLTLA
ncbi:MAG: DNA glycosylase AlkZ-like family protein, partial [Nitriliruptorales bacterium]